MPVQTFSCCAISISSLSSRPAIPANHQRCHEMLIMCERWLLRFACHWMYLCNNAVQYTFPWQGFLSPKRRKATYSLLSSYPTSARRLRRSPASKSLNNKGFSAITVNVRCFSKPNTAITVAERSSGPKRSKRSSPLGRRGKKRRTANRRTTIGFILKRFFRATTSSHDLCNDQGTLR